MTELLAYLAEHKSTVIGATITILEVLTLVINWWRKQRAEHKIRAMNHVVSDETKLRKFLWIANPINLFRKA